MIRQINGIKRKIASFGIMLMVACSVIPAQRVQAATGSEITASIDSIRAELDGGKYWNNSACGNGQEILFEVTNHPCKGSNISKNKNCNSNNYGGGVYQCQGFARALTDYMFGSDYSSKKWSSDKDFTRISPGDVIYTKGLNRKKGKDEEHAAVVWKVDNNGNISVAECLGSTCLIHFGNYDGDNKFTTLDYINYTYTIDRIYRHPSNVAVNSYKQDPNKVPTISISDIKAPTGVINKGSNYGLRGIVSTDAGKISISGGVYYMNNTPVPGFTNSYCANSKTINIQNTLNNFVIFNKLPAGDYVYYVNAVAVNGQNIIQKDVVWTTFTVKDSAAEAEAQRQAEEARQAKPVISVSNIKAPSGVLNKGSNFGLRGIVSTDIGNITIDGGVYYINNQPVPGFTKSYSVNANSINIQNTLNNYVIFNNLPEGDYVYYVKATAVNGQQVTQKDIVWTTFTVKDPAAEAQRQAEEARRAEEEAQRQAEEARRAAEEEAQRQAEATEIAEAVRIAAEATVSVPSISISGQNYPDATHTRGKNFGIRGIVSTNCGNLTSVRGYVFDEFGNVVPGFASEYSVNTNNFDLRYSINNDLIFNNLPSGNYRYVVAASAVNGPKTSDVTLIDYSFTVR